QSDRSQAELNPGFARYLSTRLTNSVIRRGKEMAVENKTVLGQVERKFDVQGRVLLAIWGMETRYGRVTGRTPVFQALATLAWEPRRATYFRGELFNALTMVQRGHIDARSMTGSWAGAMGQTQFMPSSYLSYAVDFDGDGRRDIWKSTGDTLASIANYLKGFGWNGDETWGREVKVTAALREQIARTIPKRTEGCFAIRNMTERRPLAEWQKLGVRLVGGRPLPRAAIPAGLVDVGERTFLVYPNYDAILAYNCAHYYALTVALLSDRLR
ncbi:MAG TPA: lytic murein transglycosylase, partial [Vicinamibacterales bacterium]|nr:lytic murein transglycosylase [Vicinamibacterales bacterium]